MQREQLRAWLRLSLSPGIGIDSARKLLAALGQPEAIFAASAASWQRLLGPAKALALASEPKALAALFDRSWDWLQQDDPCGQRHQIATLGDAHYPSALLHLSDPPLLLYFLGTAAFAPVANNGPAGSRPIDSTASIAIVGSRRPTPQGLENARFFARSLVESGLTVVSGLALGIDAAAHLGALDAGDNCQQAPTLAVVGTGLDRVYPSGHRELAQRIAKHGLLISEYPLDTPPIAANFPKRNRLIAALAQGTLVVEAALQSGSLITARLSNEQGKEVFAIPGSIYAPQSRGCHALIKQGAKLVESITDVLEELQLPASITQASPQQTVASTALEAEESTLLAAMGFDPVTLETLQARTQLDIAELQSQLLLLELKQQVARLAGGLFQRLQQG